MAPGKLHVFMQAALSKQVYDLCNIQVHVIVATYTVIVYSVNEQVMRTIVPVLLRGQ